MTKKEVEANEEGLFRKWLQRVDTAVEAWREEGRLIEAELAVGEQERHHEGLDEPEREIWPRSTVFFERNLLVWRQLWRTTEMSSILLILIDVRCPPLHLPPSMIEYVLNLQPKKEVILVLTKCDLVSSSSDPLILPMELSLSMICVLHDTTSYGHLLISLFCLRFVCCLLLSF